MITRVCLLVVGQYVRPSYLVLFLMTTEIVKVAIFSKFPNSVYEIMTTYTSYYIPFNTEKTARMLARVLFTRHRNVSAYIRKTRWHKNCFGRRLTVVERTNRSVYNCRGIIYTDTTPTHTLVVVRSDAREQ